MSKAVVFTVSIFLGLALILGLTLHQEALSKSNTITLTDRNTVSLNMPIDGSSAKEVQQALLDKSQLLSRSEPIYLVLNSPGGSIDDGEKIIETAQGIPQLVHTITLFSASMSFIISQYLDKRYILESGQMMSHRAYAEGLSGQVPGNLVTRTLGLLSSLEQVDEHVAKRAGLDTKAYQELIRDELWMRGSKAIDLKFADEVTRIRCAKSLNGPGEAKSLRVMMFDVKVVWHKCPLISEPLSVEISGKASNEDKKRIHEMLYDRAEYLKNYKAVNSTEAR
jgi:ATP-dependent protease ClpP protease subunit